MKKVFINIIIYFLLMLAVVISLYPISRILTISLRQEDKVFSTDLSIIPENASIKNYINLFQKKSIVKWFINSIICSVLTAFLGTVFSITAGYAFSRFCFPGKRAGLIFLLVSQMLPVTILLLPLYILLSRMQMRNSYFGLIIVYLSMVMPFCIWMMKGYFDTIPIQIEEAGLVDGASLYICFYKLILPIAKPAIGIVFLLSFMTAWQDYIIARVMISQQSLITWPIGLETMRGQFQKEYGMFSAASLLLALPAVILFMFTSRYLISGLTLGSLKD